MKRQLVLNCRFPHVLSSDSQVLRMLPGGLRDQEDTRADPWGAK
jgi:hypothetical protein